MIALRRIRPFALSGLLHGAVVVLLLNFAGWRTPIAAQVSFPVVLLGPGDVVASLPGAPTARSEPPPSTTESSATHREAVVAASTIQPPGEPFIGPASDQAELTEVLVETNNGATATAEPPDVEIETAADEYSDALRDAIFGGGGCNLADYLRARLQADPRVLDGLARLPRQARSVANALMVWDGEWVEVSDGGSAISLMIRANIESIVQSAPAPCREMEVTGPNFIILEDPRGATVLVVGSGAWRWSDLL